VRVATRRSPRRRDVTAMLEDGTTITITANIINQLTVATQGPSFSSPYTHVLAVDADFRLCSRSKGSYVLLHILEVRTHSFPRKKT